MPAAAEARVSRAMPSTRVSITRTNSVNNRVETRKTYSARPQGIPLSTGSEIEQEEEKQRVVRDAVHKAAWVQPSQRHLPVFLKVNAKLQASGTSLPPIQDETKHEVQTLISQPLCVGIFALTPSTETEVEFIQPIFTARKNSALRIHIISSPIYEVHYECSPPLQETEPLKITNRLQVAELLLKPPLPRKAQILDQIWEETNFVVAFGKHSAVMATVPRTPKQRVQKVQVEKRHGRMISVLSAMPQAPVQIKQLVQAPPKESIRLCCTESTFEARKIKEIYVEESQYHVTEVSEFTYSETTTTELRQYN